MSAQRITEIGGFTPGAIFRRRFGKGPACYGSLDAVDYEHGPRGTHMTGTIRSIPSEYEWGKELARVDLLNLKDAAWAPVFTSRIRTRGSAR